MFSCCTSVRACVRAVGPIHSPSGLPSTSSSSCCSCLVIVNRDRTSASSSQPDLLAEIYHRTCTCPRLPVVV